MLEKHQADFFGEDLLSQLQDFEAKSGIPASTLVSAATTAALNHYADYGTITFPLRLALPRPNNIIQLMEHIVPPHDEGPPPANAAALKA